MPNSWQYAPPGHDWEPEYRRAEANLRECQQELAHWKSQYWKLDEEYKLTEAALGRTLAIVTRLRARLGDNT